ncbi:MAG: D-alanyl-D-alanine carboxypeptidase [Oscillospiraceae bacterium]|jgi:D-alanyl-D-alanine carboxypeptidase|nr:D-alanyl-D-alanine carboxypeptidase [Oscillospiraceae bacterium]
MGSASAETVEEETVARAAYLLELKTGRVLYAFNETEPLPMASTTKVMTALLALENGDLNAHVTADETAYGAPGTSIYLGLGESLTLEQMLYGLMLASGNDAALAIAEHIGGSIEGFCQMMNERAVQLGASDTHFVNPNGLPADGHHTTARDLALIAAAAMENPMFREIVATERASIPWEGRDYMRVLRNKNALLSDYEGATGVKTGFTRAAGRCLVFGARRGDMEVVGVVLNCGDWFNEAARLMDDAFADYAWAELLPDGDAVGVTPVVGGEIKQAHLVVQGALAAPIQAEETPVLALDIPDSITAPQPAGAQVGWAMLLVGDDVIDRRPVVLAEPVRVEASGMQRFFRQWPLLAE